MASQEVIDLTALTESSEGEYTSEDSSEDHSSAEEEIPLNEVSRAQLHSAISSVSEARLREVLIDLVDNLPAVEEALTKEFITVKRKTREIVPRWETCVNCEEEFDVNSSRGDDECSFHPGELEADEKSFEDWDEDCHGPMDTHANRNLYPENFLWSCCGEHSRSPGCVHREHVLESARKKRRI